MRRRGFTIIELMVVVGIIVVLIAILVPALGAARNRASKTATQALLSNLSSSINAYHAAFAAYPGPIGAADTTGGVNKVNGAQNLALGLSYSMSLTATSVPLPGGRFLRLNSSGVADPSGPTNFAVVKPDGSNERFAPFFQPTVNQVANDGGGNTVTGSAPPINTKLPLIIDNISDALPVLYFRRTPGVSGPTAVITQSYSAASPTAYYLAENREFFGQPDLKAISNATFLQQDKPLGNTGLPYVKNASGQQNGAGRFDAMAFGEEADGKTPNKPRGGFVLMTAGFDRFYGTADDLVVVGGD